MSLWVVYDKICQLWPTFHTSVTGAIISRLTLSLSIGYLLFGLFSSDLFALFHRLFKRVLGLIVIIIVNESSTIVTDPRQCNIIVCDLIHQLLYNYIMIIWFLHIQAKRILFIVCKYCVHNNIMSAFKHKCIYQAMFASKLYVMTCMYVCIFICRKLPQGCLCVCVTHKRQCNMSRHIPCVCVLNQVTVLVCTMCMCIKSSHINCVYMCIKSSHIPCVCVINQVTVLVCTTVHM